MKMEKTKLNLGISVGLACVALYLFALSGAMIPLVVLTGYIFLREDNLLVKRTAIRAAGILLVFTLIYAVLGLFTQIPDLFLSPIRRITPLVSSDAWLWIERNLIGNWNWFFSSFILSIVSICQTILLIVAVFATFKGKEFKLKPIDAFINKYAPNIVESEEKKSEAAE
jgi:uncharacterized membrane protein